MSNNIVRGTLLLSGAAFLSKFLGMIYVIPFYAIVNPQGAALYQYAYVPYSIFISISTVGVPAAVAKFVSKYNALGDHEASMRMFRKGMMLMAVTGVLAFLSMFFSAEFLAKHTIVSKDLDNTVEDVKMVMRMVSFALLIVPMMSIARGFFQGHQSMGPTAVSQVIEQIVRIGFLLISCFIIINVLHGDVAVAVGFATFAAFIGALASCVVLYIYWKKRKQSILSNMEQQQKATHHISTASLFRELFSYAGPFVIVSLAIPLLQLIDQYTFNRAMIDIAQANIAEFAFQVINFSGQKLVIIPVTLATGLSLAILPALTSSFTNNNIQLLFKQINQALQIVVVLVIPAAVGLASLAYPAYGSLYGLDRINISGPLLAWEASIALFLALITVTSSILQGINQQNYAVISLLAGLLFKVLFNIQFIHMFGAKGAIFATVIATLITVALNIWRMQQAIQFPLKQTIKRMMLVIIFSTIMAIVLWIYKLIVGTFLPYEESRTAATIVLFGGVVIGGGVYLWLAQVSTLLEHIFGNDVVHATLQKISSMRKRVFHRS
ncbi:oligosaccharide flippase family protein [Virgibacillus soli]